MGLASISWNSVRVCSKLRNWLFRVLYQGSIFGTVTRIAYAHSIVGTHGPGSVSTCAARMAQLACYVVLTGSTECYSARRPGNRQGGGTPLSLLSLLLCILFYGEEGIERRDSRLVRKGGLEPPWVAPPDPKSGASANFATFAFRGSACLHHDNAWWALSAF